MPPSKHTKKASTKKCARMWKHVAKSQEKRGLSRGAAIRSASGALKKAGCRTKKKKRR